MDHQHQGAYLQGREIAKQWKQCKRDLGQEGQKQPITIWGQYGASTELQLPLTSMYRIFGVYIILETKPTLLIYWYIGWWAGALVEQKLVSTGAPLLITKQMPSLLSTNTSIICIICICIIVTISHNLFKANNIICRGCS